MRALMLMVMLMVLGGCASRFSPAIDSGWPIEEPPCCNTTNLPPTELPPPS